MRQRDLRFTFPVLSGRMEFEVVEFALEEAISEPRKDYNIEQQGDIVRDCYLLGLDPGVTEAQAQFQSVLGNFPAGY